MIDNLYITRDGEVQNTKTGNWLVGDTNNCGYRRVRSNKRRYFVHRLVAMEYLPNPNNYPQVNHKDGNKLNNCVDNLEWCTPEWNQLHVSKVLGKRIGESNGNARLSNQQACEIRDRYLSGYYSQRQLSKVFGISQPNIGKIVRSESYI